MKVGIIGAGFGGLAAAYKLAKTGIDVTVLESDSLPGGLAVGFKDDKWKWSIEKHYHHWFTNDLAVINLAKEIGHKIITVRPKTSTFINNDIYQLDSPFKLLVFPELNFSDRLRTGAVLTYLRYVSNWKHLEKVTAKKFLIKWMGKKSWQVLWEPLFKKKFTDYADSIPASWFWGRIKKRTQSLVYPEGGFLEFAKHLDSIIKKNKGKMVYKTIVTSILKENGSIEVKTNRGIYNFDKVICTLPIFQFLKLTKGLPQEYTDNLINFKGIGSVNLLLSLKRQYLDDGTYWLNINKIHFPFVAIVEHTNFMDKKYYNNEHLIYIGNYKPIDHPYFKKEAVELLRDFYPYLKTINPKFDNSWVNNAYIFKAGFAQPIPTINYTHLIPPFETPIKGLYLCNMQQVNPWDRGTNYAVEYGERVAGIILDSKL